MGSRMLKCWLLEPRRERSAGAAAAGRHRRCCASGLWQPLRDRAQGHAATSSASRPASRCARCGRASWWACAQSLEKSRAARAAPARAWHSLLAQIAAGMAPPAGCAELLARAISRSPRRWCATAASSPPAWTPSSTSCAPSRTTATASCWSWKPARRRAPASPTCACSSTRCTASTSRSRRASWTRCPTDYRRRQTLKNAERFITPELKAFEDKALSAQDRALAREKWLYEQLLDQLQALRARAHAAGARARLARRAVRAGRALAHAELVPAAVHARSPASRSRRAAIRWWRAGWPRPSGGSFIANDTRLGPKQRMQVITGPNMGGKSTYMRQVALICLLAAMGSYVPAQRLPARARWTRSTPASAPPTTWPTPSPPSCWR